MTPQEHLLMLTLYAKQNAKFNILFKVLTTRHIVEEDDLIAYQALTLEETPEQHQEWLQKAWAVYQEAATRLGVTTGLEGWQPPPAKAK